MLNIFKKKSPNSIYYFRKDVPDIDCKEKFTFIKEQGKLRVENGQVNILFSKLDEVSFCLKFNEFLKYLNLDKELQDNKISYSHIEEKIITHWMYYYTINNKSIKIRKADFTHPQTVNILEQYLKELKMNREDLINTGCKILRMSYKKFKGISDSNERIANLF